MATRLSQSIIRPPPSSPSLIALLELIPPSPVLSPSDLSTSITSGEIPILLFENSFPTAVPFDEQHDSCLMLPHSGPRGWEFDLSKSTFLISDHALDGHGLSFKVSQGPPHEDLDHTLDTFGCPVRGNDRHRLSLCWSSNTAAGGFVRDTLACNGDSLIGASQWDHPLISSALTKDRVEASVPLEQSPDDLTGFKGTSPQDPAGVGVPSQNLSLSTTANSVSSFPNGDSSLSATQDGTCSEEMSSIEFCVRENPSTLGVSTLASTSSLSRRPAIYRTCGSPKYRKESPAFNAAGDTAMIQTLTATRQRDGVATECGIGSTVSISPDTQLSAAVAAQKLSYRSPFTSYVPPSTCTTASRGYLQHYSWLENVTLSLLIDQEGFRTVQPLFKPTKLARCHLMESGTIKVDLITFVPATREVFRFHYAPLDGLPILRRLIINGDESRDFLSRQAYLSLKSSGMYTVHGTEIASPSVMLASSPTLNDNAEVNQGLDAAAKLHWQFDYSVEDRRAEQTGKVVDGEKILVPHTFTCSPHMLHPSQGKKVKLIQIVKKTMGPKLMAERKPLSSVIRKHGLPSPPWKVEEEEEDMQPRTCLSNNKNTSRAWNLHRRSQSNPRETSRISLSFSSPQTPAPAPKRDRHGDSETTAPAPVLVLPQRRRRASSVGENHIQTRLGGILPSRHIFPHSRLCQLFEESSSGVGIGSGGDNDDDDDDHVLKIPQTQELAFLPHGPSPRFRN